MKGLRQSFQGLAFRATMTAVKLFGRGVIYGSMLNTLAGTQVDWSSKAGRRYDNSVVWSAIQYLTSQITGDPRLIVQAQTVVADKTEWNEDPSIGLADAVENGPLFTRDQLLAGVLISLVVDGNGYWMKIRSGSRVVGYAYLPHWHVWPRNDIPFAGLPDDGSVAVTCYEYTTPDGEVLRIAPSEIVHFRWGQNPEPGCAALGISPIHASLREIGTDNMAATLGAALLENAGIPGIWITPKDNKALTPDQEKRAGAIVQRKITGDMAGTPMWAPVAADLTVVGFSPDKLVLSETRSLSSERILGPLRIDPMVLGLRSQNKTYANFEEANKAAWRAGCKPVLRLIARTLERQALPDFVASSVGLFEGGLVRVRGLRVWWDLSEVSEEQPDIDAEWTRVGKAFLQDMITRAEARAMIGLKSKPEDEVYYSQIKAALAPDVQKDAKKPDPKSDTKRAVMALIEARKALKDIEKLDEAA